MKEMMKKAVVKTKSFLSAVTISDVQRGAEGSRIGITI